MKPLCSVLIAVVVSSMAAAAPRFTEVNGIKIEYEIAGAGSRTVLLESGGYGGLADWDKVFESFTRHARIIRYARVGNPNSENTGIQYSARQFAQMAGDLLDELGIDGPITVVGESYGGTVAKHFGALFPHRLEAMLLIDPSHHLDVKIMQDIDLELANEQISRIKAQDYVHFKDWLGLDDAWRKEPAPEADQLPDVPVTVLVSVKRYEEPQHLLHTDAGRIGWAKAHADWVLGFNQGKLVLTDDAYHFMQDSNPEFVIEQFEAFMARPVAQGGPDRRAE